MTPVIELLRLEENFEFGTFGVLKIQKEVFCWTLEPPDLLNERNKSSIPAQQYIAERIISPKFGETFTVKDVPGRDFILFHWGSWVNNTLGCILFGSTLLKLKQEAERRGVGNSGKTFKAFMDLMAGIERFHLTITEVF